jgi:transcriptional regulator with XRE-family HTH domain
MSSFLKAPTFFKAPHVDADVTSKVKALLRIDNNRPNESLASLPATLLNRRSGHSVAQVSQRLCEVNTGVMSAEAFVAWFNEAYPADASDRSSTLFPGRGHTLGDFIASKRKLIKMTQVDLASRVGVAVSQVSRWEANQGQPSNQAFTKLGGVLDIEPYILWSMANGGAVQPDDAVKAAAPVDPEGWTFSRNSITRDMYAEAHRQHEVANRAAYTKWTEARDAALIVLKERLALTNAYEDYQRERMDAEAEGDAYEEQWGGEHVRPPSPKFIAKDDLDTPAPLSAYELREMLHAKASNKCDNAEALYEYRASLRNV